jgi:hypothetical protein
LPPPKRAARRLLSPWPAIVADLRKVHARLERTADAAEHDNQRLAVASLSSQQLRAAEVRAKIGGVGSYATPKGREGTEVPTFTLNINFGNGYTERIVAMPDNGAPTIEASNHPFVFPGRLLPDEG